MNDYQQLFSDEKKWKAYYDRLTVFAARLMNSRKWHGKDLDPSLQGQSPEDIAEEALLDVWEGRRKYDPASGVPFQTYLFGVVRSKISNLRKSAVHEKLAEDTNEEDVSLAEKSRLATAAKSAADEKSVEVAGEILLGFLQFIEAEPDLSTVFECWIDGWTDRAEVAKRLNITPSEVTNRQKRLDRRVELFLRDRPLSLAPILTETLSKGTQ
jgi:RNA polymerase sigma factor (sigma-70 family)